jgi:Major Facilitator Superfamily/Cyclic nucleotide-binding domain
VAALRSAIANRDLARLLGCFAASALGTWAFMIVLSLYAYAQGGASAVGIAVLVRMAPSAFVAPYASMLADRHSRRLVLIVGGVGRAVLAAAAAYAVSADAPFAVVLVLAALINIAGTAQKPAQAALIPQLSRTPLELAAANVCWSTIDSLAFVGGSVLVGVIVAVASLQVGFAAMAIAYLLVSVFAQTLPRDHPPPPIEVDATEELIRGFRTVGQHPELRLLVGIFTFDAFVQSMMDVLIVIAALELLDIGQSGAGWLNACWGTGGIVGAGIATALLGRDRLAWGLFAGCVLAGIPFALIGIVAGAGAAVASMLVLGVGFALIEIALLTLTQRLCAGDVLGRVYGVEETLYVAATAVGGLVGALLVEPLGARWAIVIAGLALPTLAVMLRARLSAFEAGAVVDEASFGLLHRLSLFATLPVSMVENLAVRSQRGRFNSGEAIVTQGDEATGFYVIEDGTVEVLVDDACVREEGPGEYFGEIALLRGGPRTATVRAVTPVSVLALERDDFLETVGSQVRTAREAEAVVVERLAAV